jgi:hypothetical protein
VHHSSVLRERTSPESRRESVSGVNYDSGLVRSVLRSPPSHSRSENSTRDHRKHSLQANPRKYYTSRVSLFLSYRPHFSRAGKYGNNPPRIIGQTNARSNNHGLPMYTGDHIGPVMCQVCYIGLMVVYLSDTECHCWNLSLFHHDTCTGTRCVVKRCHVTAEI